MIRASFLLFLLLTVELYAQTAMHTSPTFSETFRQFGSRERDRIFTDFSNLYSQRNVGNYGFAVLGAGVLANTSMDRHFQNWHGNHVRSKLTNEVSKVTKTFGEGKFFIPVMVTHALSYRFLQEKRCLPECRLGDFTDRTMRGYLVGAPTLLTMQLVLGGDRPNSGKSHWQPFQQDHGVSGHAFMGAVPFITAAQMTDDPYAKGLFYTLSISPAWSRVHDDVHYLSQAMLGWYLAYLSVRAISETEGHSRLPRGLTIFPVGGDDSVGIGLHYRY